MNSTTSFQSTTPLTYSAYSPPHSQPQKDYASAFANLQSTYGTNGFAPMPAEKRSTSQPKAHRQKHVVSLPSLTTQVAQPAGKNYELAFGNLSSSYGYGGGVPTLPQKAEKKAKSSSSKSSFASKGRLQFFKFAFMIMILTECPSAVFSKNSK